MSEEGERLRRQWYGPREDRDPGLNGPYIGDKAVRDIVKAPEAPCGFCDAPWAEGRPGHCAWCGRERGYKGPTPAAAQLLEGIAKMAAKVAQDHGLASVRIDVTMFDDGTADYTVEAREDAGPGYGGGE